MSLPYDIRVIGLALLLLLSITFCSRVD